MTMAFSRLPPFMSPCDFRSSTSCKKQNVRAGAISRVNFSGSITKEWNWVPSAGCPYSIMYEILNRSEGIARTVMPPCSNATGSVTTASLLGASCSRRPESAKTSTKGSALPSPTGASLVSSSAYTLSIPRPASAPRMCSTVRTFTPLIPIVVPRATSVTWSASALIRGCSGRSVRMKTTPVSGGAGLKVIVVFFPV